ncbi:hypothetical protein BVRB_1g020550 [Beta vulgaris subsp. vulgaris]|uniref:Uncharacterized protein n=1 Tax=Beta vulgaris subsp. vulgaris TaxID=3555 RepID=A0A0J8BI87_BETVV|nr:hypothetical protein BVRB_1g020550 [Beta vulgaris subsp. vulgaris]
MPASSTLLPASAKREQVVVVHRGSICRRFRLIVVVNISRLIVVVNISRLIAGRREPRQEEGRLDERMRV